MADLAECFNIFTAFMVEKVGLYLARSGMRLLVWRKISVSAIVVLGFLLIVIDMKERSRLLIIREHDRVHSAPPEERYLAGLGPAEICTRFGLLATVQR